MGDDGPASTSIASVVRGRDLTCASSMPPQDDRDGPCGPQCTMHPHTGHGEPLATEASKGGYVGLVEMEELKEEVARRAFRTLSKLVRGRAGRGKGVGGGCRVVLWGF